MSQQFHRRSRRTGRIWHTALVIWTSLGLLAPASAAPPSQRFSQTSQKTTTAQRVYDLRTSEGLLQGQVLTPQGQPVPGATVVLFQPSGILAKAYANEQGQFRFHDVPTGVYGIAAANGVCVYHVWAEEDSPRTARSSAMLVAGQNVLRGQREYASWWRNPWVIIALIVSAICVPIAVSSSAHPQ